MSAADTLHLWGVLNPDVVVAQATAAGLPLAVACAMLEQESTNQQTGAIGENVWGHDPVPTGGAYDKGGPVTPANYAAYRRALTAGTALSNGCGPAQLTYVGYQDAADRLGGCHLVAANLRVGFGALAGYVRQYGLLDAFRAYNGGPGAVGGGKVPAADIYAQQVMAKYQSWTAKLGARSTTAGAPANTDEDDDMQPDERDALMEVRDNLRKLKPGVTLPGRSVGLAQTLDDHFGWAMTGAARADDALAEVVALRAELAHAATPVIDYPTLAAELIAALQGKG